MTSDSQNLNLDLNPGEHRTSLLAKTAVVGVALLLAALLLALGIIPRLRAQENLKQEAAKQIIPEVGVEEVTRDDAAVAITLPATILAIEETTLHVRANGYVKRWTVDIGDRVTTGQVLAEIDTPDLDQELSQARAALDQAKANLNLAESTAKRSQALLASRAISQQQADENLGAKAAREADFNAAQANVQRLAQLSDYKNIIAPFDGIVTRRNISIGALIVAGGSGDSASLFTVAKVDTLRVFIDVPQSRMRDVRPDQFVTIKVTEFPGRNFTGKITRTSGALDPVTRTLRCEARMENPEHTLMPGVHAIATLTLESSAAPIIVPATSIIIRDANPLVAVVDQTNTLRFHTVELGRDFGSRIEILSGLPEHSTIVSNPFDTLNDGMTVSPVRQAVSGSGGDKK